MAGIKKTFYQRLLSAKKKDCKGLTGAAAALTAAANAYKADAVKKGKTAAEAATIVKRVRESSCSNAVSGAKPQRRASSKTRKRK